MDTATTIHSIEAHIGQTQELAFLPDGERFASVGEDRTLRIWDTRTGRQLALGLAHRDVVRGLAVASDGKTVLTAGYDGALRAWTLPTLAARP